MIHRRLTVFTFAAWHVAGIRSGGLTNSKGAFTNDGELAGG
jgi:hypothetical protein